MSSNKENKVLNVTYLIDGERVLPIGNQENSAVRLFESQHNEPFLYVVYNGEVIRTLKLVANSACNVIITEQECNR